MITCAKCGKENQDHYKFCLGCGAELPRDTGASKAFSPKTPPQGIKAAAAPPPAAPNFAPPPMAAPQPAPVAPPVTAGWSCPTCGQQNPASNKFCASCGTPAA
ncbi:MAG: hypothetical protein NVSMB47_02050 [Polyangiales bacterium]